MSEVATVEALDGQFEEDEEQEQEFAVDNFIALFTVLGACTRILYHITVFKAA